VPGAQTAGRGLASSRHASVERVQWLTEARPDELRRLVAEGEFFWLDLLRPHPQQVAELQDAIGLDSEAAGRALDFGGMPELRRYRGHVGLVFYGAGSSPTGEPEPVEVHIYVSGDWIVTVREAECAELDEAREDLARGRETPEEAVVGRVLTALTDSLERVLEPFERDVADLETQAVSAEEGGIDVRALRREILDDRQRLEEWLRRMRRQRDYVERASFELAELPGLEPSQHHEMRDVSGQMIRVTDGLDDALMRLANVVDLLNASVSNRANSTMERLTYVATIFLPLTLVTSYFGQNFGWMVDRVDTLDAFLVFGVGVFLLSGLSIYLWIRSWSDSVE
jgi:magnesium transporter